MKRFSRGRRIPRKALIFVAVGLFLWAAEEYRGKRASSGGPGAGDGAAAVVQAFEQQRSGVVVEVAAVIQRLLPDDLEGSRHQRFIVRLAGDHTVLVSHNIDLADRVPVAVGDSVEIRGQYEWNDRGGVLHWTHRDPQGRRPGGWIRHEGVTVR